MTDNLNTMCEFCNRAAVTTVILYEADAEQPDGCRAYEHVVCEVHKEHFFSRAEDAAVMGED